MADRLAAIERTLSRIVARLDTPAPEQRLLSVEDAGQYLGISSRGIRRLMAAGRLTIYRPSRHRVAVCRRELDAYASSTTAQARRGARREREAIAAMRRGAGE